METRIELTQKLINDGNVAVDEMLQGVIAARPDHPCRPENAPCAVFVKNGPRNGNVALLIGGGSGHEPTSLGFVSKRFADGFGRKIWSIATT